MANISLFSHESCPTLCDPMDPPGSSVREVLQARILEWVAISFSTGSSQISDLACVSCIGRQQHPERHLAQNKSSEIQLTLEQHRFQWCGWAYRQIFFFLVKIVSAFLFYRSLSRRGTDCVLLEIPMVESKKLQDESWFYPNCFSFLTLAEPFISSFAFQAKMAVHRFFTLWGLAPLTFTLFKG